MHIQRESFLSGGVRMQNLERRDWIEKSFGALGVMALGHHSAMGEGGTDRSPVCQGGALFWEKVGEIHRARAAELRTLKD